MYFARLSENFMSVCDKYFHFVFNITGNTSSDFLQKLQMSRAFQGEVYSIRASILPQSPSSLDPDKNMFFLKKKKKNKRQLFLYCSNVKYQMNEVLFMVQF